MIIKFIKKEIADFLMYRYGYKIEVTLTENSSEKGKKTTFSLRAKTNKELVNKICDKIGYGHYDQIKKIVYPLKLRSLKEKKEVISQYSSSCESYSWRTETLTLKKMS